MPTIERKHPLAECEECPLLEDSVFVPSDGPPKADLVLIGEAPGLNEAKQGRPFVGASGQLLNQVLQNYKMNREEVFITNVCLCRPKDNANPPAAAVRACRNRLLSEIEDREARVVVTLGNYATQAILRNQTGITKQRAGPPKQTRLVENGAEVSVVPTFHPAASLYNAGSFPDIVTDFGKVKAALDGQVTVKYQPPDFSVFDTPQLAARALRELGDATRLDEVAVDIEVGVEKDNAFEHAEKHSLLCVGISHRPNGAIVIGEEACENAEVLALMDKVLKTKKIIAQNGKFDLAGLRAKGVEASLYFDTMLAHYCLDERRGTHGLGQLAMEYLGAPDWKHEMHRYLDKDKNFSHVPRPVLYRYNASDASNTFLLKDIFEEQLHLTSGLRELHDRLITWSHALMLTEMEGVAVDTEYLDEMVTEYQVLLGHLEDELKQEFDLDNPRSWQQVKAVLNELGVKYVPTTNKEFLKRLRDKHSGRHNSVGKFCELMLEHRKESKSYGTYVKGPKKRLYRGRVWPTYLIHGTTTGRLSCRNPNLQNITRGSRLRGIYVPGSDENVFVQGDYRTAELRVVCALARDSNLQAILNDDERNIHEEVGKRFFGPDFTKGQKEKYIRAKAVVYGLSYGREAASLAREHKIPVREAQRYINTFFEMIPDAAEWRAEVQARIEAGEDLVNPFHRRRRFWLITTNNRHEVLKEGLAFLPQSTASDITMTAFSILRTKYGLNTRIPVHDSILVECRKDDAQDVARLMASVMEDTARIEFTEYVRFPVDIGIGPSWGDLKEED